MSTDVKELKAKVYDLMVIKEQASLQMNQLIQEIVKLEQAPKKEK